MDPIDTLIKLALEEDIGSGDVTTEAVFGDSDVAGEGRLIAKQDLVLSGQDVVRRVFETVDAKLQWETMHADGERVPSGTLIALIKGSMSSLLIAERTALNFLQQLCGIATYTARFVEAVQGHDVQLRDTRKTIPGLRALSKVAVKDGGGTNHRMGLYDQFLVKDNHIAAAGGITECLRMIHETESAAGGARDSKSRSDRARGLKIQVEVRTMEEVVEALQMSVDSLLLDNMSCDLAKQIAGKYRDRVELEVSGNVTLDNVKEWAATGVHAISIGALTHSAPAADISLQIHSD